MGQEFAAMVDDAATAERTENKSCRSTGGAPIGNTNAWKHGLKPRRPAIVASLPEGYERVTREKSNLARLLAALILDARGIVQPAEELLIQSAVRWEQVALLAQKWLRDDMATLTPDQRLAAANKIAQASDARDRVVRALGLERLPDSDRSWLMLPDDLAADPTPPTPPDSAAGIPATPASSEVSSDPPSPPTTPDHDQ